MAKIGIFGGSFDPPHLGHILALEEFYKGLELDLVLVIPAGEPPHKKLSAVSASAEQRLAMTRRAVAQLPFAQVSDIEICRSGASYTSDTLLQLRKIYPSDTFYLLMGTDMFRSFSTWHDTKTIVEQATLVGAYREGAEVGLLQNCAAELREKLGARCIVLENSFLPYSSTCARAMIAFGCGSEYVSAPVYRYILDQGLYYSNADLRNLDFDILSQVSISLHDRKRVPHVLGCSETAAELALHYGENVENAKRAGILHDVTKALGPLEQLKLCDRYDIITNHFYRENTKLLHAKTGAAVAERLFGENKAVCDAICWHTTGRANMTTLEKILYLADYVEPNRRFSSVQTLRDLTFLDLDAAMELGLNMTMEQLAQNHRQINEDSLTALRFFKKGTTINEAFWQQ